MGGISYIGKKVTHGGGGIVTDGLVLYLDAANPKSYPGTGNTWIDISNNGYNGTLANGSIYTSNNMGSIYFDGINDYVNISSDVYLKSLQVPMTICGWFKTGSSLTGYQTILGQYWDASFSRLVKLVRLNSGTLWYYTSTSSGGSQGAGMSFSCTINTAYFFAIRVGGSIASPTLSMRLNSTTELKSLTALSSTPNTVYPIYLGNSDIKSEYFSGNIFTISIYNRELSTSEIDKNFNALRGRYGI